MLGLTLLFPLFLFIFGSPDTGPIITGYLGIFLQAAAFLSVGLWASSLTQNQIVAAIVVVRAAADPVAERQPRPVPGRHHRPDRQLHQRHQSLPVVSAGRDPEQRRHLLPDAGRRRDRAEHALAAVQEVSLAHGVARATNRAAASRSKRCAFRWPRWASSACWPAWAPGWSRATSAWCRASWSPPACCCWASTSRSIPRTSGPSSPGAARCTRATRWSSPLAALVILGLVNVLGSRYQTKLDLTANKQFTLSDQSIKVAQALPAAGQGHRLG